RCSTIGASLRFGLVRPGALRTGGTRMPPGAKEVLAPVASGRPPAPGQALGSGRGLSGRRSLVGGGDLRLDTSALDDVAHGLRRLGANAQPVLDAVGLQGDGGGVGDGIVRANNLNEPAVPRRAAVSRHNPVAWSFLGSHSP